MCVSVRYSHVLHTQTTDVTRRSDFSMFSTHKKFRDVLREYKIFFSFV